MKYTRGYEGFAAKLVEVLDEPAYLSEDIALPKAINGMIKKDPNTTTSTSLTAGYHRCAHTIR